MNFHVETNRDRLCDTIWPDRPLDNDLVLTGFPVSSTLDLESLETSVALLKACSGWIVAIRKLTHCAIAAVSRLVSIRPRCIHRGNTGQILQLPVMGQFPDNPTLELGSDLESGRHKIGG
jgi:hypothetical protein